jgi:hypothetical protein
MPLHTPDLTQFQPRSPRVRLGGYVILPRCLDKGRATLAGKNGEYHFGCPLDYDFLDYVGLTHEELKPHLNKSDSEVLAWINANAKFKRTAAEIAAWSAWQEQSPPDNPKSREHFNEIHKAAGAHREDILSWFDLLDMDDFATFGGKP